MANSGRVAVFLCLAACLAGCAGSGGGDECSGGKIRCSGVCVDTNADPGHCGSCSGPGHLCPTGATCDAGACACPADAPDVCNGACVDLRSSSENCGTCGHACGLGTCTAGSCDCDPGTTSCDPPLSPQCVDTSVDPLNCGSCGHLCATEKPGSQCGTGSCQCLAPRPSDCLTFCTNTQTDVHHCGGCNAPACPQTNDICVNGQCACPASLPDECDTLCVNTATDASNCGACTKVCATGASCISKVCTCPATSPIVCGSRCTDPSGDGSNCGTCGNACPAGGSCSAGTCLCPAGSVPCGRTGGAVGQCCQGNGCCGTGACQTIHDNGLGRAYYDCDLLNAHTKAQATLAAHAWSPSGDVVDSLCAPMYCLCTSNGSSSAVWCFDGPMKGTVAVTQTPSCYIAQCPVPGLNALPWN